jgi:HEAT repeat protein
MSTVAEICSWREAASKHAKTMPFWQSPRRLGDVSHLLPLFVACLHPKESFDIAWTAVVSLGFCRENAGPAGVDLLIKALHDPRQQGAFRLRDAAAHALASIGPDAKAAVPYLMAFAQDTAVQPSERQWVIQTLDKIDSPAARNAQAILGKDHDTVLGNTAPPLTVIVK